MMRNKFLIATLAVLGTLSVAVAVTNIDAIAYWRMEDGSAGIFVTPTAGRSTIEGSGTPLYDSSGNGNTAYTWDDNFTGHVYANSTPGSIIPTTAEANSLSIENSGDYPATFTWSNQSSPSGTDVETIAPAQWTIEASIKATTVDGTYRTFLGREGNNVATANASLAPLYFQITGGTSPNRIRIQYVDQAGNIHAAITPYTVIQGRWYNVAAVCDGSDLFLYVDQNNGNGFELADTADLTGSANSAMVYPGTDENGDTWGWTLGRGRFGISDDPDLDHTDRFLGFIDEVRISDQVLTTNDFLFYSTPVDPVSYSRQMENLDRGVVAVRNTSPSVSVYVGWRMLGTESDSVGYNVYRNGTKLNGSPITDSCNYLDASGNPGANSTYSVAAVVDGVEQELSDPVGVWDSCYLGGGQYMGCHEITLEPRSGYEPNDACIGDLDGDGDYELVLKRLSQDISHSSTTFNLIEAYQMDGTLMWTINLGPNNLFAPFEINPIVYDFDGDGRAEVVIRTCEGNIDGTGVQIGDVDGDGKTDYRSTAVLNSSYYMIDGPEFISVFDGETGAEITREEYIERDPISQWGLPGMSDAQNGHRADKCMLTPAYLDGKTPSLVISRGIYHKTVLEAWNFRDGTLTKQWTFNSDSWPGYDGQGNHNLTVGDVDGDGKDEIVYGQMTVDHDGTGLYTTLYGHGDAIHMGEMIPGQGLQIYGVHEGAPYGADLRNAATGEIIWSHTAGGDTGRGSAAHIDANYPGYQMWDVDTPGTYDCSTEALISSGKPNWGNFLIWWDADLQREILDGVGSSSPSPVILKWNPGSDSAYRVISSLYNYPDNNPSSVYEANCINGTKSNPCISGDLIGDWREEAIFRSSDNTKLYLYTTCSMANNRIYTLMHDSMYRTAIAWQCNQYNQPPHPSFYIGAGMDPAPTPNIYFGAPPPETNLVVNSNDSGAGSLRQVVADSGSGDTVVFTNTLSAQTITLTSGHITVANDLTIDATSLAGGITIDGNANGRIFEFSPGSANVLVGLTLSNGLASGTSPDNKGGAIHLDNATLAISNCTLTGNTGGNGGGIQNENGSLTLLNSTIAGNNGFVGGGVHNTGTLTIQHATLIGNSATLAAGGVYNTGSMSMTNTIVSDNNANSNPNIFGSYSGANNLVDASDIGLAPLGDYGGSTLTMPPVAGSPAIDAAGPGMSATDQRGFARVGTPDIGAAEFQGATDVALFWDTDWDDDGNPYGVELALGLDPFTPDAGGAGTPMALAPGIAFGFNPLATNYSEWVVYRSLDLMASNSFAAIYRFDGPTGIESNGVPVFVNVVSNIMEVVDESVPLPDSAYYKIGVEPSP